MPKSSPKSNAAKTTEFVKKANGGSASKSGVNRLKQAQAYPKMPRFKDGGDVSNDDFIQQMMVGTLPTDQGPSPADERANKMLRALGEGVRGTFDLDALEPGSEAYRTGQALANIPPVGMAAGAIKGISKADLKRIGEELETSKGRLAELVSKYPQIKDASVAEIERLTKGEPLTVYRGISLLPGKDLRKETTPSTTLDAATALSMIKNAPIVMRGNEFISATPVLRTYSGLDPKATQAYVPSLIDQIIQQQPAALEMKIPTRSGEKMSLKDIFEGVKGEKEVLTDVSKTSPVDILFNRYKGGVGDQDLMEVTRLVLNGEWNGGETFLKKMGSFYSDPAAKAKELNEFAELVKGRLVRKRADGSPETGEVSNDDFIQQMMTGTPPTDQEPGFIGQGIKAAGQQVYENFRQAIQEPGEFHKRALGNIAKRLEEDPEGFAMDWTGGGLGGVIKPKGGVFPKEGSRSGLDKYLERIEENAAGANRGEPISKVKSIMDFINTKGRKYLTSVYGAADDPLRAALLEGRLPRLGDDKTKFRDYLMNPARSGDDPLARQDFELFYDQAMGIQPMLVSPTADITENIARREGAARQMMEKMRAEGTPDEFINMNSFDTYAPERMIREYSPEYMKNLGRQMSGETLPADLTDEALSMAVRKGEPIYDISYPTLDFMQPINLAKSLSTLDPAKLQNMSFAEAVIQGTKNTRLQRDWAEVVRKVRDGKNVDRSMFEIGTEKIRPMGDDQWVRLTSGQAAQLEGAAMRHSIGGYADKGDYGHGGLEGLMSGKAQLFSLRSKDGTPRVTIEALKRDDGALKVTQIKGRFNGLPQPEDQARVVEFLKDMPVQSLPKEYYRTDVFDKELPDELRSLDWAALLGQQR